MDMVPELEMALDLSLGAPAADSIGARLVAIRHHYNMKQLVAARNLNVDVSTLSDWENDHHVPSTENIIAMAKLYHVTTDWLLGLSQQRCPSQPGGMMCDYEAFTRLLAAAERRGYLSDLADLVQQPILGIAWRIPKLVTIIRPEHADIVANSVTSLINRLKS